MCQSQLNNAMAHASENDFWCAAQHLHCGHGSGGFTSVFGCSPAMCALTWNLMDMIQVLSMDTSLCNKLPKQKDTGNLYQSFSDHSLLLHSPCMHRFSQLRVLLQAFVFSFCLHALHKNAHHDVCAKLNLAIVSKTTKGGRAR